MSDYPTPGGGPVPPPPPPPVDQPGYQPGAAPYPPYPSAHPTHPTYATPYGYASAPVPSPPSSAMATWALVLAILICVPLAWLVSIVLAIVALVQVGKGRASGKGRAIAALVINGLVLTAVVGFVVALYAGAFPELASDEPERDESGQVTKAQQASADTLRDGDCFDNPDLTGAEDEAVQVLSQRVLPCTSPHDLEVYATSDISGDTYPGQDRVQKQADRRCLRAFEPFVGKPLARSVLVYYYLYPSPRSWRIQDDHTITCAIGVDGVKSTGTLRGSRR